MERRSARRLFIGLVTFVALLAMIGSVFVVQNPMGAKAAAPSLIVSHGIRLRPQYRYVGAVHAGVTYGCQTRSTCFGPKQYENAYEITPLLKRGITGKGRTIVIIDAFQSPTIQHDLQKFDSLFGLNDPTLNVIAPDGLTPFNPMDGNQVGWSAEITLDVEWAHSVAPGATIDLVLAKSNQDVDILSATSYAIEKNLGDVISQSFGEGETCVDPALLKQEHEVFQEAVRKHITLFASSGDQGAAQPTCDGSNFYLSASSPATDPFVTAVGGTTLNASGTTGAYGSETAWSGSGGGYSTVYARPEYQEGVVRSKFRGEPDVSMDADPNSGVLVVWSSAIYGADQVFIFGGTSASSPTWAGVLALTDQLAHHRQGFINDAIYRLGRSRYYNAAFHDITSGNNSFDPGNGVINGYNAGKGWDAVTGWGSPKVEDFAPLLIAFNHGDDFAHIH